MSGNPDVPTATGDGWCGWSTPITGDGWPRSLQTVTGDGWCPIQTGKKRGKRRVDYGYLEKGAPIPPIAGPWTPEPVAIPPRDMRAENALEDRVRELESLARERKRKQNQRALELLLLDD